MCKTFPGARCASHTWSDYSAAVLREGALISELKAETEAAASNSGSTMANSHRVEKLVEKIEKSKARRYAALQDYDSTPTGQRSLQTRIATLVEGGEHEKANALQKRLDEAVTLRATHQRATDMQNAANKVLRNLDEGEITEYEDLQETVSYRKENEREFTTVMRDLANEHAQRRNESSLAFSKMDESRGSVEEIHSQLNAIAATSYVESGIDPQLALSYAQDTETSAVNGWEYFSNDSHDRMPRYAPPVFKVKGEGHKDHEGTLAAQERFNSHPRVQALQERLAQLNKEYSFDVKDAQRKAKRLSEHTELLEKASAKSSHLKKGVAIAEDERNDFIAKRATGIHNTKTFNADVATFRRSSYIFNDENGEPTTNAYVYVKYGDSESKPYYARVLGTKRTKDGVKIQLNNGLAMSAEEFSNARVKLTAPPEDAQKLFG